MKILSCIDLFSGAGGFSLGLSRNNIDIVLANEIEKDFAKTFELNHPKTKMLNKDIHNVDVNIGPSCSGVNSINSGKLLSFLPGRKHRFSIMASFLVRLLYVVLQLIIPILI